MGGNFKRFAFRNINTVGTTEIKACGDNGLLLSVKQEAPYPLGSEQFTINKLIVTPLLKNNL